MIALPFTKYHGCGNDFIIVDSSWLPDLDHSKLIPAICDRHTGIGADGFIVVEHDPLEMVYYNQDGSRAPMCGNGIRCFSKFCLDEQIVTEQEFDVETLAGTKKIKALDPAHFLVDMQKPLFDLALCSLNQPIWGLEYKGYILYTFFMSTVHTVVFIEDAFMDISKIGEELCNDPLFPEKTNVNFVTILDSNTIQVQTYERGCGVTLACGTGVCASAYVAYKEKGCASSIHVCMKKGALDIEILTDDTILMSGPAALIAKGEFYYES